MDPVDRNSWEGNGDMKTVWLLFQSISQYNNCRVMCYSSVSCLQLGRWIWPDHLGFGIKTSWPFFVIKMHLKLLFLCSHVSHCPASSPPIQSHWWKHLPGFGLTHTHLIKMTTKSSFIRRFWRSLKITYYVSDIFGFPGSIFYIKRDPIVLKGHDPKPNKVKGKTPTDFKGL